jgi:hypothetical protein
MSGRARCLLSIRCRRAVGRGGRAGARLRQDPDHRLGRSRALGAGAAIVTIPVGAVTLRRPRPRKRRGGWPAEHPSPTWVPRWARLVGAMRIASLTTGLVNGVQDGSAIPANVTTQASRSSKPVSHSPQTATGRPSSRKQTSRPTRPDAIVKANSDVRLAALRASPWVVAANRRRRRVLHRTDPHRAGWASPSRNWQLLIPPRRLPERSHWWAARQRSPDRRHADPRFDALAVSMTSPRVAGAAWRRPTSRTNGGQMIKGLAAEDSDQALDRLERAGLGDS